MYHEFYSSIFTVIGFPCDPYDGAYRWLDRAPSATIITAVERLPSTEDAFRSCDLSISGLSATQILAVVKYQSDLKIKARKHRYFTEADGLLMEALYDSIRTDGKSKMLKDSEWAKAVASIKQDIPIVEKT